MLRAALSFLILAFVAFLLGAYQIAGVSMDIGKMLLGVFLFIAVMLFAGGLLIGQKIKQP